MFIRNLNDCVGTCSLLGPKPQTYLIFRVIMEHQLFILSVHPIAGAFMEMPFDTYQPPHSPRQTVENSSRDGNARPPDLPPEKSVCRSRRNS